jgi:tetratricopeptide (TPR) repeat protein
LKLDPQAPVAANNLAWILAESGSNLDEALALARIAKDKLPNNTDVLDTMGWVYYKKGAYASATDLFKGVVVKDPKNPLYQYHLGLSYFQTKNTESARASLSEAIKLDPAFPGVQDARNTLAKLQSR